LVFFIFIRLLMTFRKIALKIHLYLGLTCGLIASFSGLTGSLYVWQPEITALLNPKLLKVENFEAINERSFLKTAASLSEIHKDSITQLLLPYREQQTISILFKNGKTLYYHPVTQNFLGEKTSSILFFEDLLSLHRTLGIPNIGKYIIGGSTLLFLFFLLTSGAYIWWKIYAKNLLKGFKIKWNYKISKLNFTIHKALGIYFLIPLAIIAFSGAYFTYIPYYKSALKVFDGFTKTTPDTQKNHFKNTIDFNDLLRNSTEHYALRAIYFPKDSSDKYRFRYIKDRPIKAGLRKTKEVELTLTGNATILSDFSIDSNSNRIAAQFYPIHIGEIMGVFGRFLVFVSGFIPFVLFITGCRIYFIKKNKK